MQCPKCSKTVPEGTLKCGCGYVFEGYKEPVLPDVTVSRSNKDISNTQNVTVTDIKMPFGSMVGFMVKWVIASIPAIIILIIIFNLITAILVGLGFGVWKIFS